MANADDKVLARHILTIVTIVLILRQVVRRYATDERR